MAWDAGDVETSGLQLCSMENHVEGGRKKKTKHVAEQVGGTSSSVAAAIVAGAWLTPRRRPDRRWSCVT